MLGFIRTKTAVGVMLACLAIVMAIAVPLHAAVAASMAVAHVVSAHQGLSLTSIVGVAVIGQLRQVKSDNDSYAARASVGRQYDHMAAWFSYFNRNRIIGATAATWPAVAIAGTNTKVKVANSFVALLAGVPTAVTATDNAFTLTGGNLAAGFTRKYLLLSTGGTTFSVQASSDEAVASNCTFSPRTPPDGTVIAGVVTIANASLSAFVPGTTALTGVSGVTVTYVDGTGDDQALPFGNVVPN